LEGLGDGRAVATRYTLSFVPGRLRARVAQPFFAPNCSTLQEDEMSRGMPSMMALLGLLAVAGYQNRDKIAEMLGGLKQPPGGGPGQTNPQTGQGGVLGNLGGLLGGATAGSVLSGGLGDLVDRFRQSGQGQAADSRVGKGPNQPIRPDQLEQAIGPDVLATLSQKTGLSQQELISRLTRELPDAVDKFTPEGRLPTEDEAARLI
jgi:uncharacterized protein YidB (DUF937 family)